MLYTDRLQLSTERKYTDEGFLNVPARISRVGTQVYTNYELGITDEGTERMITVYRPEEEVFDAASLLSFANKPVTNGHPPELVTPTNSKKFSVGMSDPSVVKDGMFASTNLSIIDADAIASIESGKVELSNGYTADLDWTPGVTPDGEVYDAVQRNIKGNHIAIVERGRAGPSCRVADNLPETGDKVTMAKITIDGVDYEVPDQAAQAVSKLQTRCTDAEAQSADKDEELKKKEDEMEEEKAKAKKTEDGLTAKLDDATSKIPDAKAIDKMVADRVALVDSVHKVIPGHDCTGKDAMTLRKEVVAANCSNVQMDSVSDDYVIARFDMLVDAAVADPTKHIDNALNNQLKDDKTKTEDTRSPSAIARDKFADESRNAWKTGGGQ